MTTISIELIKQLREETGAGVLECRQALETANANYARALGVLREKGLQEAARKADHPVINGVVEIYSHGGGRIGVMVEINTETDFAARSRVVRDFAHELALQVAAAAPVWVREEDIPEAVLIAETTKAADQASAEGKPERLVERIIDGRLRKFKDENVLLRQPSIRDDSLTIAQMLGQTVAAAGENIVIRRFARFEIGED
jgi:elongation factor Ts